MIAQEQRLPRSPGAGMARGCATMARASEKGPIPVEQPLSALDAQAIAQRQVDEAYMALALEEARKAAEMGEVPIGAIVVYEPIDRATRRPLAEPRVVARAHNLRETLKSPSAHAEFLAIQQASEALDAWRLSDCTVYVTLEPCIMCAGLMHQARVRRCVYGAADEKAGACGTLYDIHADERLNHRYEVTAGVLEDESRSLLRAFFAARRKAR